MYKVALIDDEHIIVEGLRRVLPWEKMGCIVVGMASDGVSGLDLIREKKLRTERLSYRGGTAVETKQIRLK